MDRLDKTISQVAFILDSLKTLRDIYNSGSCNDCQHKKYCNDVPRLGQQVRYNCPYYAREGKNE